MYYNVILTIRSYRNPQLKKGVTIKELHQM